MVGIEEMVSRNLQTLFLTNRTRLFNGRSRDKYSQAFVDQNRANPNKYWGTERGNGHVIVKQNC